jgi:protein-disulfide isomerase
MAPEACAVALTNFDTSLKKITEKLKPCRDLVDKLCADLGPNTQSCNTVKSTTPAYSSERCSGMLSQYAEVLKPLKIQEDRQKPLSPELIAELANGATAPAFGPADAKVTVVEFADFECPYSARAMASVQSMLEKYGKQVRFVFRQFPLTIHRNAETAAEASLAAHAQGKFWQFHDKAFNNQSLLTRSDIERYAKEVGLDVAKLKAALDAKTYAGAVAADLKLGEEAVVDRTPAMFVNGKRVMNPSDAAGLARQIEEALKTAS